MHDGRRSPSDHSVSRSDLLSHLSGRGLTVGCDVERAMLEFCASKLNLVGSLGLKMNSWRQLIGSFDRWLF